jgi:hypothetical protein
MKNSTWSLQSLLTWIWIACLGLLLLTACTPLRFNTSTKHIWVISLGWFLSFVAAAYFARRTTSLFLQQLLYWLPRVQWAGMLVLLIFWIFTVPFLGRPVLSEYFFPYDDPDYAQAYPLLSRGNEQVYQVHWDDDPHAYTKAVRVRFLPILLVWATPLPPASLDSTWKVRSAEGLELLAPRYRQAAKADLASRWYESQNGVSGREAETREAARLSRQNEAAAKRGEDWRTQHPTEATHYNK